MERVERFFPKNSRRSSAIGPPVSQSSRNLLSSLPPPRPPLSAHPPQILIIGAGSRGSAYARCIVSSSNGMVAAVADPDEFRRKQLVRKYIWGITEPTEGMEFAGWKEFIE